MNPNSPPQKIDYVIVSFGSLWIEGDERSRTHPGHGYPGYTLQTEQVNVFETEEAWLDAVERHTKNNVTIAAYRHGKLAKFKTVVKLEEE